MRWHLRNHNCKQILLGVSHDAGYAPFIEDVVTVEDKDRITIVEGPPTVRELKATGLPTINFSNIFRKEKLISRPAAPPASTSWAGITVAAPPPSVSPVMAIKTGGALTGITKKPAPKPVWVPGPRGLDAPIIVNAAVLESVKRRTINNKLCNNHYLRGPCAKGDDCVFEHRHKPSDEELKAIAHLSRLNPCTNGQDCESEYCIYGHHCPSVVMVVSSNGKDHEPVCQAFGCRFSKDDHPEGTVIKHPRKERWEKEYERY
jgi:hypothetical protein